MLGIHFIDYNSSTPLDKQVLIAMEPYFGEIFGNASSRDHKYGWDAAEVVEDARWHVAELIGARTNEIIFTSGATESLTLALKGACWKAQFSFTSVVTCVTEHEAVLETCRQLNRVVGTLVHILPVDSMGRLDVEGFAYVLKKNPKAMCAVMLANNEVGTLQPIKAIAENVHQSGGVLLSDITQAVGKIPVNVNDFGIDLAAFSSHKIYGPKGVGALFLRGGVSSWDLEPLIPGGGQECGLRGGTLNVPGIVGFGEACRIAKVELETEAHRVKTLRDGLERKILKQVPDTWVNGDPLNRLGNTTNIGFKHVDARTLIRDMHDIAVSTQSACASRKKGPSHVLKALGLTDDEAYSCIRFSLGRFTTEREIDYVFEKVSSSVEKIRRNQRIEV